MMCLRIAIAPETHLAGYGHHRSSDHDTFQQGPTDTQDIKHLNILGSGDVKTPETSVGTVTQPEEGINRRSEKEPCSSL